MSIEIEKNYRVFKSNQLIDKSRYELSVLETKLICYIISKIKYEDEYLGALELRLYDICLILDITASGKSYLNIKDAFKRLKSRVIEIEEEDGILLMNWLHNIRLEHTGVVYVQLNPELETYLLSLREKFTAYTLYYILKLNSKYAIRLYELMKCYQFRRDIELSVEELQMRVGSNYSRFADFNRRVLKSAVAEINEETDLTVEMSYIRVHREIKKVKFCIRGLLSK